MPDNRTRSNSRLNKPNRKKKTNTILNVLIGIVLLLIIVVVMNIVLDKGPEKIGNETKIDSSTNDGKEQEDKTDSEEDTTNSEEDSTKVDSESNENASKEEAETETEVESESKEQESIDSESSEDPLVEGVIVDPSWTPIGTTQTGVHASDYDRESVDWEEKLQALSYASGLDRSNMYVKFLGNGGSPQKSVGTVTSKDGTEIYRIHLEWIDGEGWKPTQKEKLSSLEDAS